jgi:hypothetical protein
MEINYILDCIEQNKLFDSARITLSQDQVRRLDKIKSGYNGFLTARGKECPTATSRLAKLSTEWASTALDILQRPLQQTLSELQSRSTNEPWFVPLIQVLEPRKQILYSPMQCVDQVKDNLGYKS